MERFVKYPDDPVLQEVRGFYTSSADLLYLSGDKGCGKSELIYNSLDGLENDFLIFQHNCFIHSVIDDFLLNFYDTLREYSASGKIHLKKSLDENFAQKVSYYFKNLEKNSIIIIDNFEDVESDTQILNFLSHLASYKNVKLVILSRSTHSDAFEGTGLELKMLNIKNNSLETFSEKILYTYPLAKKEDIKILYEETKGYELYLRMTLNYIITVGISFSDFIGEFLNRKKSFEEFLLIKVISLVPEIYFGVIQNLTTITHVVTIDFLEKYQLGERKQIEYLVQKLIISQTAQGVYLKDYIRDYFLNTLSVQDKISNSRKLIEIYENELSKSPKDRLLRLSRESIRKQMESTKISLPHVNVTSILRQDFSYMPQAQSLNTPWVNKDGASSVQNIQKAQGGTTPDSKSQRSTKEEEILRKFYAREDYTKEGVQSEITPDTGKNSQKRPSGFKESMLKIREFEEAFDYQSALGLLYELYKTVENEKHKEIVLKKLAVNHTRTSKFEEAIENYNELIGYYQNNNEPEKLLRLELKLAQLFKSLYRFEKAREYYTIVLESENKELAPKALLGLAEIFEGEHNNKEALALYEKVLEGADSKTKAETYFKMGLMYDGEQNSDMALYFYKKCAEISSERVENKFLSQAYSNIALIYNEKDEPKIALEYFNFAIMEDEKTDNLAGIHFNTNKIAQVYRSLNIDISLSYFEKALEYARKIEDGFKIASALVDIGDIYYDKKADEKALRHYLEAKKVLGEGISRENSVKIDSRVNDMRIKMGHDEFEKILEEYEKQ